VPITGPYNSASIDGKTGSPDPADLDKTWRLCWLRYAKVAQPLHELPELRKMDHGLVAVRAKNKMANVGSSRHCLRDLGILQPPQRDMPRNFARYANTLIFIRQAHTFHMLI
jgi:hypothetical protein